MTLRVLHHNNCFDGACSAAVFTKFHRECIGGASAYEYRGLNHAAAGEIPEEVFGPGENAIVDFKYSTSPRLTWWFDHHQSAFLTPEDRAHFERVQADAQSKRQFFDPDFVSCTSFIAKVGREQFGFDTSGLLELLHWADLIDGARYETAASAVEMKAPAMQLGLVIENAEAGSDLISRIIPLLTELPLSDIAEQPFVADKIAPLWNKHVAAMQLVRERAELRDGVIFFDLTDHTIEGLSKFIPYYYFPDAIYTVALTRSSFRAKISVGTNPWTAVPHGQLANIADICERFGGGGHARVGAISFRPEAMDDARKTAARIVSELRARDRQQQGA